MKNTPIVTTVGGVLSAVVLGASVVMAVLIWKQPTTQANNKSMAVNDCAQVAKLVEVRGSEKDGWNVTTNKVDKDTYAFCMKEKGFEVSQ